MNLLVLFGATVAVFVLALVAIPAFRNLVWNKWLRGSHVMGIADAVTVGGLAILADPQLMELVTAVFADMPWLVPVIGVGLRLVRRIGDPAVAPKLTGE